MKFLTFFSIVCETLKSKELKSLNLINTILRWGEKTFGNSFQEK